MNESEQLMAARRHRGGVICVDASTRTECPPSVCFNHWLRQWSCPPVDVPVDHSPTVVEAWLTA